MSLPTCPVKKCGTHVCDEIASVRVFWPGKAIDLCVACAVRAGEIADAMGFDLSLEPLTLLEVTA